MLKARIRILLQKKPHQLFLQRGDFKRWASEKHIHDQETHEKLQDFATPLLSNIILFIVNWSYTSLAKASADLKQPELEFHLFSFTSQPDNKWLTDISCHKYHSVGTVLK